MKAISKKLCIRIGNPVKNNEKPVYRTHKKEKR